MIKMRYRTIADDRGFSLIELLLALAIGVIVISALYISMTEGHRASTGIEQKISAQQDVRAALDIIGGEVAMASFNPLMGGSLWVNPTTCQASTAMTNKGIQIAAPNQLAIEMDINESGSIATSGTADPNEVIIYNYDAANQQITRQTGCAGPQAFLGNVGAPSATARNVLVVNTNATLALAVPMFRYFDGSGTEIFPTVINTAPIPNIRKIRVTIIVQAASSDVQGQKRIMTYSSDIIPRNHVIPASSP